MGLGDELGNAEKLRHRLERPAHVILVQARDDHPFPLDRELIDGVDQLRIEKLPFVDADDLRSGVDGIQDLLCFPDKLGLHLHVAVADDVIFTESAVEQRLENLDSLFCDLCPAKTADEFFALSAEHTSADHLNPSQVASLMRKLLRHRRGRNYTAV